MGTRRYRHPPKASLPNRQPGQLTLHETLKRRGRPLQQSSSVVPVSLEFTINPDRAVKVQQAQQMILDVASKASNIQRNALNKAIELLYPYAARSGQLEALFQLMFKRGDLILIAKTSFGKSMIPQALSILMDRTMTIVILPLIQIGIEQSDAIKRLGGHPLFLEKDVNRIGLLVDIKKQAYTHLLLSPELAGNEQMRRVFEDSEINRRITAVVIDEAHLVHHWGDAFRPQYAQVGKLRIILGPHIPWFACSATLDPHTLKVLMERGGFKPNTVIHRTSIDRPELVYRVGTIPRLQ